ncbi:MAG: glycosyltransferase, partial [Bullifex sp.]
LERKGHDVKVLTLSESVSTHIKDNVIYIGSMSMDRIYPDIRVKHPVNRRFIQDLIDWKPDVIHTNTEFSTYKLAKDISRKTNAPMIHTYHTDYEDYVHYLALSKKMGKPIVKAYIKHVTSYMQAIIAPTEKTKLQLQGYGIKKKIIVIPTGLDLTKYNAPVSEEETEMMRKRHGIRKDVPTLIFVGRLGKEKNLLEVINYLSDYREHDYQFLIVGDGPDRKTIEQQIATTGLAPKTVFTGMVSQDDIAKYYRLGSIFVSASQSETQGLTYIEALSSGLPLLCKKDECLDNVLLEGETGWSFTCEEEFKKHLTYFIEHPEEGMKMRTRAKEFADTNFSSDAFASRVLEIYEDAVKNNYQKKRGMIKTVYHSLWDRFPLV